MRKVFSLLLAALLVSICSVDFASAQGQRGQRGGMGFGGNQADTISDALVLTDQRAEKVKAVCDEVTTSMQTDFSGFRDLSQEERMKAIQTMREKMQTALTEKLATVLTADELTAIKPILSMRGGRTVAEIRALRQIEINDETRGKLQTVVLIYENTLATLRPQGQPSQRGQGGQQGQGMSEEVRTKMETARTTLLADIEKVLTADQVTAWQAQTKKVQEELDAQRTQRGGPQGQGQGQGQGRGQRGQGQGGGRGQN